MKTKQIKEALEEFLTSEEGERIVGQIVIKAVNQALAREIQFEDRKADPGNPKIKTESWNLLDWLCKYLPYLEGAMRGVQNDADQARDRAVETRDLLVQIIQARNSKSRIPNPELETLNLGPETRDPIIEIQNYPTQRATGNAGQIP